MTNLHKEILERREQFKIDDAQVCEDENLTILYYFEGDDSDSLEMTFTRDQWVKAAVRAGVINKDFGYDVEASFYKSEDEDRVERMSAKVFFDEYLPTGYDPRIELIALYAVGSLFSPKDFDSPREIVKYVRSRKGEAIAANIFNGFLSTLKAS